MLRKRMSAVFLAAILLLVTACSTEIEVRPEDPAASEETAGDAFGDFTVVDLEGDEVTQDIFADKKLTLVNVWATWCSPCIQELPELEELSVKYRDSDFQVIGICADLYDPSTGKTDESAFETADYIKGELALTYTNLVPDAVLYERIVAPLTAYPTTFFVDENGILVGDPEIGSTTFAQWEKIMQTRMQEVTA